MKVFEILKRKYIKFMQDDYIKYLKSEAEKINEIEKMRNYTRSKNYK